MLTNQKDGGQGRIKLALGGVAAAILISLAACGGSVGDQSPTSNPGQSSGSASSPAASTPASTQMPSAQPTQSSGGGGGGWG